jgi:hypothetical protein
MRLFYSNNQLLLHANSVITLPISMRVLPSLDQTHQQHVLLSPPKLCCQLMSKNARQIIIPMQCSYWAFF